MKLLFPLAVLVELLSHPARGAWIEISAERAGETICQSHPARGAWIEIGCTAQSIGASSSRTPQGVRGLKFLLKISSRRWNRVAPRKGCVD